MTFPGFCGEVHDKEIFSIIENIPPVFSDFRQQLLFSYRVMAHGYRKIELILDATEAMLKSDAEISEHRRKHMQKMKPELILKFNILSYYKSLFENELTPSFDFSKSEFLIFHATLPKIGIAGSLQIGGPEQRLYDLEYVQNVDLINKDSHLLDYFFVTIIPTNNSQELIVCWKKGTKLTGLYNMSSIGDLEIMTKSDLIQLISDFLIGSGDHWVLSEKLYKTLNEKGRIAELLKIKEEYIEEKNPGLLSDGKKFNMFEGLEF